VPSTVALPKDKCGRFDTREISAATGGISLQFLRPEMKMKKPGLLLSGLATALLTMVAPTAQAAWALNMTQGISAISRNIYSLHMMVFWVCVAAPLRATGESAPNLREPPFPGSGERQMPDPASPGVDAPTRWRVECHHETAKSLGESPEQLSRHAAVAPDDCADWQSRQLP